MLLGKDKSDPNNDDPGRSDTILVVHLNAKRNKAYIISFPRDMYVAIPGHGRNKINAAYACGGPALTVRTLEGLTETRMDHVVEIDFEGFIQLTEDLGGVTVTNKTEFSSHGFDYPKGKIEIEGEQALWFVRERKALPGRRSRPGREPAQRDQGDRAQGAERGGDRRPGEVHPLHRQRGQARDGRTRA